MSEPPRQLIFDLQHRSALGREDFLVSRSNAAAVALIDRWPDWAHWAAFVSGPAGSGKSHLAHVWRSMSGAEEVAGLELSEAAIGRLAATRALVVEAVDSGIADERVLFHLLNLAREHRLSILILSRLDPGELSVALPDLRSRLKALPLVRIDPPDEGLIKAVLVKLFADRQLLVEPHVIDYLGLHLERSLDAANRAVVAIDQLSLEKKRKVTRAVAAEALASLGSKEG